MQEKKTTGPDQWIDPDDAPSLTQEMLNHAETFDGDAYVPRGRGRPRSGTAKEQISIRIDQDVAAKLRQAGPGWQSQINIILRGALGLEKASTDVVDETLPDEEMYSLEDDLTKSSGLMLVHDADKAQTPPRTS